MAGSVHTSVWTGLPQPSLTPAMSIATSVAKAS
jgi:hypothetical protein